MLKIQNLHVSIAGKPIVKGIDLQVGPGEVHAIMGPNGSGKSTLAYALAGHPKYQIVSSKPKEILRLPDSPHRIRRAQDDRLALEKFTEPVKSNSVVELDGKDLLEMSPDERAKAGLFLAFQYPVAIEGVTVQSFLRQAYGELHPKDRMPIFKFRGKIEQLAEELEVKKEFLTRYLNEGFSGGEKKRVEILQMRVLKPKYAICDETDSGLDIDALQIVAQGIKQAVEKEKMGCVVITHYQRILQYLNPDKVHVMVGGKIVKTGGDEVIKRLERSGYKSFYCAMCLAEDKECQLHR